MNAIKDAIKSGRTVVGTTVTPNVDYQQGSLADRPPGSKWQGQLL